MFKHLTRFMTSRIHQSDHRPTWTEKWMINAWMWFMRLTLDVFSGEYLCAIATSNMAGSSCSQRLLFPNAFSFTFSSFRLISLSYHLRSLPRHSQLICYSGRPVKLSVTWLKVVWYICMCPSAHTVFCWLVGLYYYFDIELLSKVVGVHVPK
jgi:hypothetical protein